MTDEKAPGLSERGSVAVETALLVPLVFAVILLFSEAAFTWRMEGATHRATAALADVLSNQRMSTAEELPDRMDRVLAYTGPMFIQMVTGESSVQGELRSRIQYGVQVTYYNTAGAKGEESFPPQGALTCKDVPEPGSLRALGRPGTSGSLVTADNKGMLQLVRVDACIKYAGSAIRSMIMPGEFSSSFIAVRREE